jgi:hypothetical protein
MVFVERIEGQIDQLLNIPFAAKFGGATGNFNAHKVAFPKVDWVKFGNDFVEKKLGLERMQYTTQIEHYDSLAAQFDSLKRINTILIDLCRDVWQYISMEYFKQKVKAGEINFDVVVASPDAMRVVGQLGQVLGPRGLMPNPKDGTVTMDVANAVKNAKAGQVRYRTDKAGVVHCMIGKLDFEPAALAKNLESVLVALKKAKPNSAKGVYFKKVTVSSTMGPGLQIDMSSVENL